MKNLAITRVPSVKFSSKTIHDQTIYLGVDEFTHQMSERIRASLLKSGVECSEIKPSFKPAGSGFNTGGKTGKYFVTVSVEREVLPEAEALIWANPYWGAARTWDIFEPLFAQAVMSAFPGCSLAWMTEDEFVESVPSA